MLYIRSKHGENNEELYSHWFIWVTVAKILKLLPKKVSSDLLFKSN